MTEKSKGKNCSRCGKSLSGVETGSSLEVSKLTKSEKVPERPYSGVLCPNCLEDLLRYKVRFEAKFSHPEKFSELNLRRDLTLEKFLPRDWYSKLAQKGEE